MVSIDQDLKKGTSTSVPGHISNTKGEDVIFQNLMLLKVGGAVQLSTTAPISLEIEQAYFDEQISHIRMSAKESDINIYQKDL